MRGQEVRRGGVVDQIRSDPTAPVSMTTCTLEGLVRL